MGWILGLGLVIIILYHWPLLVRFTLKSDPSGNNWHLQITMPYKSYLVSCKDGLISVNNCFFGFKKQSIITADILLLNEIDGITKPKSRKNQIWQKAFISSLKLKKISFKIGLKGSYSGEAMFLFGLLMAVCYPICGYWHFYRRDFGFIPELTFDRKSTGFSLNCIITFCLGQLITEAAKRYQALWKERKDAR